ncbi:hypothetical protein Tco_0108422 [Tanacetum coccineum]
MRKHSPKFSGRITPLTPSMLEVATALAAEEANSASTHSRAETTPRDAQGTPSQSAAQDSLGTAQHTADIQGTTQAQSTAEVQDTATAQDATALPKSPNDYTPTDASQTSGGDEGLLDLYALNREVKRLKRQTLSQAKQITKLKINSRKSDPFFDDIIDKDAAVTPDLERKSDETEEVNIEEKEDSNVKSGETEELDLETTQ